MESHLLCDRHIVPGRVLVFEFAFENASGVPAHFELCGAARWVLPRREEAIKEAEAVAGNEDNGIVKLVSLHAREGGSFGGITNGFD